MALNWTALSCAAAALVGAGVVHGLIRLADMLDRSGRVAHRDWIILAGLIVWIALLVAALRLIDLVAPDLADPVAAAAVLGMTIGKPMPGSGQRPGIRFESED
ncbi:hypothetical protein HN018_09545 [Lichenicola cladoniae]|uniref:Uncharacterized protein n=1 Tax=Lichenicola cladoniae TaxID=1484109 RepID=A0A6M8HPH0_9PROT|nr:hypothetical protein [Lichenicola cladoniae]NPD66533.1 hypothetical protein [Acetobacteraceae bacterium]QKE90252.1 hypothetical protein HN018_09545 [Lichenicola cladoniae]